MKTIKCSCGKDIMFDDVDYLYFVNKTFVCENRALRIWVASTREKVNVGRFIINIPAGKLPDHIDRNTHNNQKANLRVASNQQNIANRRFRGVSGYQGVSPSKTKGKWNAKVCKNGQQFHLGSFSTPKEAAEAYDKKANELFGEFANLNFPIERRVS